MREKSVRERPLAAALVLAALTLAVFLPVLNSGFINLDDPAYVTDNAQVKNGLAWDGLAWAFTSVGYASNWHPLTWLSHMLDVQLFGLNPVGHHATSLLLHAVNAGLLLLVLRRLTGVLWPSAFVAALFALHPLHVESVAWVAERKDVLSTFFWIATMGTYLRYVSRPGTTRFVPVLVCFALGLMAKPMLVTLPFLLLLLDYWPLRRWGVSLRPADTSRGASHALVVPPRVLMEKIPLLLLAIASSAMTLFAQQGGMFTLAGDAHFAVRFSNAVLAYVRYAAKAIWPVDLTVLYPLATPPGWQVGAAAVAIAGVTGVAVRWAGRYPFVAVGWFWFLGTLVPVIGMTQRGAQAMADRYTYMPLTGLFIAAAWGVSHAVRTRRARKIAVLSAAIVLAVCAMLTRVQVGYWHDSTRLFGRAAGLSSSWLAHKCFGEALRERGRLAEAVVEFRQALSVNPLSEESHASLGDIFYEQGKLAEAAAEYEDALRIGPLNPGVHTNLANVLDDLHQADQALLHYQEALRIDPGFALALSNLGLLYERRGMIREAADNYRRALASDPLFAEAHNNLGSALLKMGQAREARAAFEDAVRLCPGYPLALTNLGLALERLGETGEAEQRYREALRLDPDLVVPRARLKNIRQP